MRWDAQPAFIFPGKVHAVVLEPVTRRGMPHVALAWHPAGPGLTDKAFATCTFAGMTGTACVTACNLSSTSTLATAAVNWMPVDKDGTMSRPNHVLFCISIIVGCAKCPVLSHAVL